MTIDQMLARLLELASLLPEGGKSEIKLLMKDEIYYIDNPQLVSVAVGDVNVVDGYVVINTTE